MIAHTPGKVFCFAENSEGKANTSAELLIGNQEDPVAVKFDQPEDVITIGDDLSVTCSALIYFHTPNIEWRTNNNDIVENSTDVTVVNSIGVDTYTYESKMTFKNIQESHKGFYTCKAFDLNGTVEEKEVEIDVLVPVGPRFPSGLIFESEHLKVEIGEAVLLKCNVDGTPMPAISWYKDNQVIDFTSNDTKCELARDGLIFHFTRMNDTAVYKCVAQNKEGSISKEWTMEVMSKLEIR
jgi:hemicentin